MNENILLLLGGFAGVVLIVTGARCWLAEHDREVLQQRRVIVAPESSGAGCLAWLLVLLGAVALWVYLALGS